MKDKAYLAAEYDYHMIPKDEDRINYIASLYIKLYNAGLMDYKIYPSELFGEDDEHVH
jgi:hypothetical protein